MKRDVGRRQRLAIGRHSSAQHGVLHARRRTVSERWREREREIGLFKALFSSQISHHWIWERERESSGLRDRDVS